MRLWQSSRKCGIPTHKIFISISVVAQTLLARKPIVYSVRCFAIVTTKRGKWTNMMTQLQLGNARTFFQAAAPCTWHIPRFFISRDADKRWLIANALWQHSKTNRFPNAAMPIEDRVWMTTRWRPLLYHQLIVSGCQRRFPLYKFHRYWITRKYRQSISFSFVDEWTMWENRTVENLLSK